MGTHSVEPFFFNFLQKCIFIFIHKSPVSIGLTQFPVNNQQIVTRTARLIWALKGIAKLERYLLYSVFLLVKKVQLSITLLSFLLLPMLAFFPIELYVRGFEHAE